MKKQIIFLIGLFLTFIPISVNAATGTIKASVSSTNITLDNTFTVTVKVSSTATLGSWSFTLDYDSSKLSLQSGDTNIVAYGDGTYSTKSYTYKFKAIAVGSASITFGSGKIADWDTESYISTSTSGVTVTIKKAVVVTYSSDNNLSSLSIDGIDISPTFDKSTLEYTATAEAGTTSVTVNAKVNDSKATVTGTGAVTVAEGDNTLNVVVTAENGSTKTYAITLTVPEKDPIEYDFDGTTYYILRKLPDTVPLNFYTSTKTFNEEEIPCLYNDKVGVTLLYLKDKDGNSNYYIYNEKDESVILYNEITSSDITIYVQTPDDILSSLISATITINNVKVNAWQINKNNQFYIIYGTNTLTNKTGYYVYDAKNETVQLFDQDSYEYLIDKNNNFLLIIYIVSGVSVILLIITILMAKNKKKYLKIINKITPSDNLEEKPKTSKKELKQQKKEEKKKQKEEKKLKKQNNEEEDKNNE